MFVGSKKEWNKNYKKEKEKEKELFVCLFVMCEERSPGD